MPKNIEIYDLIQMRRFFGKERWFTQRFDDEQIASLQRYIDVGWVEKRVVDLREAAEKSSLFYKMVAYILRKFWFRRDIVTEFRITDTGFKKLTY